MTYTYFEKGHNLLSSIQANDLAQVKEILDSGFNPNYVSKGSASFNGPAINYAITAGNAEMVAAFIEKGADVNYINGYQSRPLDVANSVNNQEIIRILEQAGARNYNSSSETPEDIAFSSRMYGVNELISLFEDCAYDASDLHYASQRIGAEYEDFINSPLFEELNKDCAGKQLDGSDYLL